MARGDNFKAHTPPRDSIWRCPCGWTSEYFLILGHRKGHKKRPDCTGKIFPAPPGAVITYGTNVGKIVAANAAEQYSTNHPVVDNSGTLNTEVAELASAESIKESDAAASATPFEYKGDEGILDAEEIARQINQQRTATPILLESRLNAGHGEDLGHPVLDGDFVLEPATPADDVSSKPESVSLPVICRIMFDWAKSQGWNQGDGSFQAFIVDCLLDHFNNCWGMVVMVARRDEIGLNAEWVKSPSPMATFGAVDGRA